MWVRLIRSQRKLLIWRTFSCNSDSWEKWVSERDKRREREFPERGRVKKAVNNPKRHHSPLNHCQRSQLLSQKGVQNWTFSLFWSVLLTPTPFNHVTKMAAQIPTVTWFKMASLGILRKCSSLLFNGSSLVLRRTATTESGALVSKPTRYYNLVLFRLGVVAVPFVYLGYWAGGQFAEFLEEHEFYIPDEDDDDWRLSTINWITQVRYVCTLEPTLKSPIVSQTTPQGVV